MASRPSNLAATVDRDLAARSALYGLLVRAFDNPDEEVHAGAVDGSLQAEAETYVDQSALTVDVPAVETDATHEDFSGTYNRLFTLGHAEYVDRTDGSMETEGPPVPLYESKYRDADWQDVNVDLARAYDYFGVSVDTDRRDHHDNIRLELEFAAYLARREAAGEADAGRARRDLLDRHLVPFAGALRERLAEVEGGFYADLALLLDRVVTADREALADEYGGGENAT